MPDRHAAPMTADSERLNALEGRCGHRSERDARGRSSEHVLCLQPWQRRPQRITRIHSTEVAGENVQVERYFDANAFGLEPTHFWCAQTAPEGRRHLVHAHHRSHPEWTARTAPCAAVHQEPTRNPKFMVPKLVHHAPTCLRRAASRWRAAEHGEGAADRTKQLSSPGRQRQLPRGDSRRARHNEVTY